jgi:hypothetical protein
MRIPRIARCTHGLICAPATERELDRMHLADNDQPFADEPRNQCGCNVRASMLPDTGPAGSDRPLYFDDVLHSYRKTVKRAEPLARSDRLVGGLGRDTSGVAEDGDERAKLPIFLSDTFETGVYNLSGQILAGAGGFEPPHGGIKIHCLTTWRRPNRPVRKAAGRAFRGFPFGNAGL